MDPVGSGGRALTMDPLSSEAETYRTCSECGSDCEPEPTAIDGLGGRIVFACAEHGVQGIVDPFHDRR